MTDFDVFLDTDDDKGKEAKYNIFRFQDHLLDWISLSSQYFFNRDYPNAFEAITNVYSDAIGFFTEPETKRLNKLFEELKKCNSEYISYNINYEITKHRIRNQTYKPPMKIYEKYLEFRMELMKIMAQNQLLIQQKRKGKEGAGSA